MIEKGHLQRGDVTADRIRSWLHAQPAHASSMMEHNPSYVFFKAVKGAGPIGAQGVVLTPERSLAVDWRFYSYGLPVWVETTLPGMAKSADNRYHRLFVAQDTGGAIRGVIRGDVFFGHGPRARLLSSAMKQQAQLTLLVPKTLSEEYLAPYL